MRKCRNRVETPSLYPFCLSALAAGLAGPSGVVAGMEAWKHRRGEDEVAIGTNNMFLIIQGLFLFGKIMTETRKLGGLED